jgi:hypothetical protein
MDFYGLKRGRCVCNCFEVWTLTHGVEAVVGGEYFPIFTDRDEAYALAERLNERRLPDEEGR